ncbi:MAG: cell division protein FtsK [Candidatus Latescibacteria bacterium]|nr:cell division protein FtsK [Candidatus Latescibacterota bacterium]NIM20960.1 cell division protein FtsK [Candidatus Latescibacterota bacterium]NIM65095.1 cell division protein FtsK [Candidatus Latescibacterota bacterium]NIO01610.1 cell division protein FtsK [Candidatus Latescibacterota bacterium]NIO28127.1 cell division protein FtsK [Candidatus Latescibacterota bacterium]
MNRKEKAFFSIALIAFAAFVGVALVTVDPFDWPFSGGKPFRSANNLCGPFGSLIAFALFELLGKLFAWFIPIGAFSVGAAIMAGRSQTVGRRLLKATVLVVLFNAFFSLSPYTSGISALSGTVGRLLASGLSSIFGEIGGTIVLIACLLLILLGELKRLAHAFGGFRPNMPRVSGLFARVWGGVSAGVRRLAAAASARAKRREEASDIPAAVVEEPSDIYKKPWVESAAEDVPPLEKRREEARGKIPKMRRRVAAEISRGVESREPSEYKIPIEEASLPDLSILEEARREDGTPYTPERLKSWSAVLEEKLRNYNVEGRVGDVHHGPLITTFEFEPAPGVKIKDIVSRSDDLALALRAKSLRMIAPIPGRAAVGIEIPNPEGRIVRFREVLKEVPERLRVSGIMIALGVDVVGRPFFLNLCSAPHLLVAGTTGSGKSVCLNVIISSILFQHHPSEVRLIIVDPKMVEMNLYNGIPHLVHPVINDPKVAARVFSYLTAEMQRRNELFRESGVKNIESYNSKIALGKTRPGEWDEKLPYIVLIIDELGDLTLAKGVDIETFLSRISQMARAVGIHMVVATQRPSVDVIIGKTKANFPTRIAFRVATRVDSRTILDSIGAEKLIGRGDMLHMDAKHPEPVRLHGAFLSEEELERLVSHWKSYEFEKPTLDHIETRTEVWDEEDRDPLFEEAKEVILRYRQGSTSLLQRKLHIGYARAARLLDQMEQVGIVGPPDSSKPREVLVREQEEIGPTIDDYP